MKTFKGKLINVLGEKKNVGDQALNFRAISNDLDVVSLSDYKNEYIVINVVPSLDTSVCDIQTRTINQELTSNKKVLVLTISNDLPFAQKKWCAASGLDNVVTLSDHRDLDFANKYGVLISELRLLARSVFVLNKKREIIYLEYLNEMTHHLNYDALLTFVRELS